MEKSAQNHLIVFCLLILLIVLLHQANAAPNDPVSIPDAILRGVIEAELGKSPSDTITEMDMGSITHITESEA